jgi:hypothetical protein
MLPMRSAREAAARGARAAKGLDTRSLIVGACLTLVAASLGYAARGPGGSTNGSGTASAGAAGTSGSSGGAGTGTGASGAASGLSTGSTDLTGQAVGGSSSSGGAFSEGSGGASPASAAGGGSGSGGTSGTVAPNTPLTASDQGVTPKTIKLGFLIANTSNLAAAGFNVGVNGDQGKVVTAWFNELNRTGGIDGRQLTNYNYTFDVLDTNDMTAGCKTMTQDQKVFSVITTGGYDSTAQLCIAKENKTPLISTDPEPASWYPQSAPYLWATFMNKDRLFLNQAKWLASSGYVRSTDKVGVIYHDIPNVAPSVTGTLLPALARNGIHPTDVVKLASDSNQALAQIQNAVLDMRTKGVTFVIFDMNLIFKTQFMQYAQNQQWFPRYTDTDEYFGCEDFVTTTYPPQAFNGTECLGTTLAGINPQHYPVTAFTKYADQVYDRTYPQGYSTNGSSEMSQQEQQLTNYELGSEILLWANAAKRAGPNPTRAQWGIQMGRTGAWTEQVGYCSASFGPAKWDGSDELSVDQYHAEASGGWQADKFHQLAPGCFKNWF